MPALILLLHIVCLLIALLSATYWVFSFLGLRKTVRAIPMLADVVYVERKWPKISVLVPACNEGPEFEAACRAKLTDGYPNLELVLVDDRSTDETASIVDGLAAEDPRVVAVHIKTLPEGWLGKVHALERARERATGDWLLLSDADVHFEPGTLKRALDLCETKGLDHLGVYPELRRTHWLIDAATNSVSRLILVGSRAWALSNPASKTFFGVGAFNMVRRATWELTPGFEWLKLEIDDDVAVGLMMRNLGAPSGIAWGRGHVFLSFYPTLRSLFRGAEKSAIPFRFSAARTLISCAVLALFELGAWAALGPWAGWPAQAVAIVGCSACVATQAIHSRIVKLGVAPVVLSLLGSVVLIGVNVRSGLLAVARGGLRWRDTFYRGADLVAGRRLP